MNAKLSTSDYATVDYATADYTTPDDRHRYLDLGVQPMDQELLINVADAVELLYKQKIVQLGRHPLLYQVRNLLRRRGGLDDEALTTLPPVVLGDHLRDLLIATIATMQPAVPIDVNRDEWRHYIILTDYFLQGQRWSDVANRLHLARARFYDCRKAALAALAAVLARLEQENSDHRNPPRHNLPHPPYAGYVPRYNEEGKDYVETIIAELNTGRAWFIASDGAPGVGKTTIAYETALRASARTLFDAIIWTSAKQQHLRLPGIINIAEYITSIETILDAIGTTLGNREILCVADYDDKAKIVRKLLTHHHCLLIVDNLESLSEAEQQRICAFMENLPRPSKGLITGRERRYVGMYTITITGMQQSEALRFMREEAKRRTVPPFNQSDALRVYTLTHGNPLAMQQLIGLIQSLGAPLEEALAFDQLLDYQTMLAFMYAEAYNKLKDTERMILQILPLFAEPAAAEAIAAASNLHSVHLSLGLQRLYRAFLIQRTGETRYELLPFARQFLRTHQRRGENLLPDLPLDDFLTAAHQRLAHYYIEYLRAMNLDEQLRYLKSERKNILGLMEWCYTNHHWQLLVDLIDCMSHPLGTLRYLELEMLWGQRGMEACDHLHNHAKREWFKLYCVAWPHLHMDEAKRAHACEMIEESVKVAQEFGYVHLQALALRNLGRISMRNGDHATALQLLEESLSLWQAHGDLGQGWIAHTSRAIGEAKYHLARHEEALEALLTAWHNYKQQGDTDGLIATTSDMALVRLAKGEDKRALAWSDYGLTRAAQIKKPARAYAYAHQQRAELEHLRHNQAAAAMHAAEAIATYEALGMAHWVKTIKEWLIGAGIR